IRDKQLQKNTFYSNHWLSTSNLYPTPLMVFTFQKELGSPNLSRILLICTSTVLGSPSKSNPHICSNSCCRVNTRFGCEARKYSSSISLGGNSISFFLQITLYC